MSKFIATVGLDSGFNVNIGTVHSTKKLVTLGLSNFQSEMSIESLLLSSNSSSKKTNPPHACHKRKHRDCEKYNPKS